MLTIQARGLLWVFTRSGGNWAQQGPKLVGTDNTGAAEQGNSVALSADGNTAIVGGEIDNAGQGAAWVFTRSSGTWAQQGTKLVGTGNTGNAEQGFSVSLNADGNTAIIGAIDDNGGLGAAWVFTRNSSIWTQQGAKLVGTGSAGIAEEGFSVSLNADGNTAIIGSVGDNGDNGAAWVFTRSSGTWAQQGTKLVGTGSIGPGLQGWAVSLSADGNIAIVGAPDDNSTAGAAWVYGRSGGTWAQQGTKLVGTGAAGAASQGYSVSLSADGSTAVVGGYGDNAQQGAVWAYTPGSPTITSFTPSTGPVGTLVTINGTNLNAPTAFTIGGQGAIVVSNDGSTLVAMVMPNAVTGTVSLTTGGGTATGSGNFTVTATPFPLAQQGAKLVGTGNTGLSRTRRHRVTECGWQYSYCGRFDNSGQGAAWVYVRSGGVWAQQGAKLVGTGNTGAALQGSSVALSADGNTAIVGAVL